MKRLATSGALGALVLACASLATGAAHAATLDFDDLSGTGFFLANYQGFRFGNNSFGNAWFHSDAPSTDVAPRSGANYVATDFRLYGGQSFEDTMPIVSAEAFSFEGAWFSGEDQVRYKLYNGNQLVHTSVASAQLSATPQWVQSGYNGLVTRVVVSGKQGYYAMDDFTYDRPVSAVPEPASVVLLMAGLGLLGLRRMKGRQ